MKYFGPLKLCSFEDCVIYYYLLDFRKIDEKQDTPLSFIFLFIYKFSLIKIVTTKRI